MELHIKVASLCIQFFCDLYKPLFIFITTTPRPSASASSLLLAHSISLRGEIKFWWKWNIHFHSATDGHLNLIQLLMRHPHCSFSSPNTSSSPALLTQLYRPPLGNLNTGKSFFESGFVEKQISKLPLHLVACSGNVSMFFQMKHLNTPRRWGSREGWVESVPFAAPRRRAKHMKTSHSLFLLLVQG